MASVTGPTVVIGFSGLRGSTRHCSVQVPTRTRHSDSPLPPCQAHVLVNRGLVAIGFGRRSTALLRWRIQCSGGLDRGWVSDDVDAREDRVNVVLGGRAVIPPWGPLPAVRCRSRVLHAISTTAPLADRGLGGWGLGEPGGFTDLQAEGFGDFA